MLVNISGAETQNEIAGFEHVTDSYVAPIPSAAGNSTPRCPCRSDLVSDGLPGDSRNRLLHATVNVRHDYAIRIVERATKFLLQRFGARIAMRLKHREHALATNRSRRLERRADFRRMMPVIVHQQKTVAVGLDLEPPARVFELRQRLRDLFERNTELVTPARSLPAHCERYVDRAHLRQLHPVPVAAMIDPERGSKCVSRISIAAIIGPGGEIRRNFACPGSTRSRGIFVV